METESYIVLKAPAQAPHDLSGLVEKPGDFNGDLEAYVELKTPKPDSSGLVTTIAFVDQLGLKADRTELDNCAYKQEFNDAAQLFNERVTVNENDIELKANLFYFT
jgi:hypothetical protein